MRTKEQIEKEIKEINNRISVLNTEQYTYKIFLNSVYGQLGSEYFPLVDLDNAEAVTTSGQHVIKKSYDFVTDLIGKNTILFGDTDSLGFDLSYFFKDKEINHKTISEVLPEIKEFIKKVNENCVKIVESDFNSNKHVIEFKLESISAQACFLVKKNYVLHILYDGTYTDKFKYTGGVLKKNEISNKIKDKLKNLVKTAMIEDKKSDFYTAKMGEIWEEFCQLPPEQLAFIKNFKTKKKTDTEPGFLTPVKGSTIIESSAQYFNDIIDHLGISNKYEKINLGDRIYYLYVKPNKFYIPSIGFKDKYPEEFKEIFEIDYYMMFEKIVMSGMKNFENVFKWREFNLDNVNENCDIMSI